MSNREIENFLKNVKEVLESGKSFLCRDVKVNAGTLSALVNLNIIRVKEKILIKDTEFYFREKPKTYYIDVLTGEILTHAKKMQNGRLYTKIEGYFTLLNVYEPCYKSFKEYIKEL